MPAYKSNAIIRNDSCQGLGIFNEEIPDEQMTGYTNYIAERKTLLHSLHGHLHTKKTESSFNCLLNLKKRKTNYLKRKQYNPSIVREE